MDSTSIDDEKLVKYLLGKLPAEEEDRIDDMYFTDNELFERLEVVEEELIERYVRNSLSPDERSRFEKRFMTSAEYRDKIEFVKGLIDFLKEGEQEGVEAEGALARFSRSCRSGFRFLLLPKPAFQVASLVILVVSLTSTFFLISKNNRLRSTRPATSTFGLDSSTVLRGDQAEAFNFALPEETDLVSFNLLFEDEDSYDVFHAELLTKEDELLWYQAVLKVLEGKNGEFTTTIMLPAAVFDKEGDYIINISGSTPAQRHQHIASFLFSVIKKQDK